MNRKKKQKHTKNKPPPQKQTKPTTTKHTQNTPHANHKTKTLTPTKRPNTLMNYIDPKDA